MLTSTSESTTTPVWTIQFESHTLVNPKDVVSLIKEAPYDVHLWLYARDEFPRVDHQLGAADAHVGVPGGAG